MSIKIKYLETFGLFRLLFDKRGLGSYLSELKNHHPETFYHSCRVGLLVIDLGLENEVVRGLIYPLGYAGVFHDLGKKDISLEILAGEGPLGERERKVIREHPRLGFVLAGEEELTTTKKIIIAHHEYQSNPYPRGREDRRKLPRDTPDRRTINPTLDQLAQIVAVADMADALKSQRSYKKALSNEEVEKILKGQFFGESKYAGQVMRRFYA